MIKVFPLTLLKLLLKIFQQRILNQIIKCLNQIISENKPYNLRLCTFTLHKFQEKSLKVDWNKYQDSLMAERQTRDLEVRVQIPVQVQIFLLKFM